MSHNDYFDFFPVFSRSRHILREVTWSISGTNFVAVSNSDRMLDETRRYLEHFCPTLGPPDVQIILILLDLSENTSCAKEILTDLPAEFRPVPAYRPWRIDQDKVGIILGTIWSDDRVEMYAFYTNLIYLCIPLMKREIGALHASAIAVDDRGVLFVGYDATKPNLRLRTSGVGKTTLALSLVMRSQFDLVADDFVLLQRENHRIRIIPWLDTIGLCEKDLDLFPAAKTAEALILSRERQKVWINAKQACRDRACHSNVTATQLIVISRGSGITSTLMPMPKYDAFQTCLYSSRLFEGGSFPSTQFELLSDLVDQCECFRLVSGEGIEGAVMALIDSLR